MLTIEFYGNPGVGKSTVCDLLQTRLQERGLHVANIQKRERCDSFLKKIRKLIFLVQIIVAPTNIKLEFVLIRILGKRVGTKRKFKWFLRILEANFRQHNARKHGFDIALLDEGIIQHLSAFELNYNHETKKQLLKIKSICYSSDFIFFDCILPETENISRIIARNKPGDEFLLSDNDLIKDSLRRKRYKIDYITKSMKLDHTYLIDTDSLDSSLDLAVQVVTCFLAEKK